MPLVPAKLVLASALVTVCPALIFSLKRTRSSSFCLEVRPTGPDDSVGGTIPLLAALVDAPSDEWQDFGACLRVDVSVGAATVSFFNSSDWQEGSSLGVDGLDDSASALKRAFSLGSRRR